jgi:Spy/CpxP family protein refolding chaperone
VNRASAVALVTGVFLAGVAVGALGVQIAWWQRGPFHGHGPFATPGAGHGLGSREWPGGPRRSFAERMQEELDLTAEQQARIAAILRDSFEEGRKLREAFHPQIEAHMERTAKRIDEVLDPAQREKFKRLREERARGAHRFFFGSGARPPWSGAGSVPFERGPAPDGPPGQRGEVTGAQDDSPR